MTVLSEIYCLSQMATKSFSILLPEEFKPVLP